MKKLVPILAALALAACGGGAPSEPHVTVENAVVTAPAVPGGPGAAYFTLTTNREGSRLVAITSPAAETVELHVSREENGRSRMLPLPPEDAIFSPSEPLEFTPGGKHGMLMGMDPAVQPGGKVTLTLQVEPLGSVTVEADVRPPGQAHAGH